MNEIMMHGLCYVSFVVLETLLVIMIFVEFRFLLVMRVVIIVTALRDRTFLAIKVRIFSLLFLLALLRLLVILVVFDMLGALFLVVPAVVVEI
jgi:hypothetical protein